jgi:hypothetical protein
MIIDVCIANDPVIPAGVWKSGFPLEALRSLAVQGSIGYQLRSQLSLPQAFGVRPDAMVVTVAAGFARIQMDARPRAEFSRI